MNKFLGSGYVSTEPELRCTQSGRKVCSFSLAVRRTKEITDFLPIVCWESTADFMMRYFRKGSRIEVEGRLQQRRWTDGDGKNHSRVEVIAESLGFGERVAKQDSTPTEKETDIEDEELPF